MCQCPSSTAQLLTAPPVQRCKQRPNTLCVGRTQRKANGLYKADGRDKLTDSCTKANDTALGVKVDDFGFSARSHAETTRVYKPRPQSLALRWIQKKETSKSRSNPVSKLERQLETVRRAGKGNHQTEEKSQCLWQMSTGKW